MFKFPVQIFLCINLHEKLTIFNMVESLQESNEEGGHSSEDSGHCSPEPESEFLKVHAQLTHGKFSTS